MYGEASKTGLRAQVRTTGAGGLESVEIETRVQDGVRIVKLKGRLSMGPPLDKLNATMNQLQADGETRFVLDVEEVPTIDSSGIGMLVRYLTTAKQAGGNIRLLKPSKFTVQTLKMVGLLNLFTVYEEEGAAVASFQQT
jgi:anti-sigma B factor antagonist